MALSYHHVDPDATGATGGDGSTWEVDGSADSAFNIEGFIADFATAAAGDVYFVKPKNATTSSADIVLTADIVTTNDGTINLPIVICGVNHSTTNLGANVVVGDFAQGTARPYFDGGTAYGITCDDFAWIRNIRIESADTYAIRADSGSNIDNCYANLDYTSSSDRYGIATGGTGANIVDCEARSANCYPFSLGASTKAVFCYAHDATDGTRGAGFIATGQVSLSFCISDTCRVGVLFSSDEYGMVFGCTFYNGTYGIYENSAAQTFQNALYINNIFADNSSDDIICATATMDCYIAYNNHHSSIDKWDGHPDPTDTDKVCSDLWATAGDPVFTNEAGGDFSLGATSACLDVGMALRLGVGA